MQRQSSQISNELDNVQISSDVSHLQNKILAQVEYYFSDANLRNDYFLNEQMVKYQGYVPISLIHNFNKIKKMGVTYNTLRIS